MKHADCIDTISFDELGLVPSDAFEGKVVVVRGASGDSSAGHAIARAFAQHGASLVLAGSSRSRLKSAASEFGERFGSETLCLQHGHEEASIVAGLVDRVVERFGRIDVLVNAALVAKPQFLKSLTPQDLGRVLDSCTILPFEWMRACLPYLAAARGTIISLGSRFAEEGLESLGALATAMQGFAALNDIAAKEWEQLGVSANIVQPLARNARFEACEREDDVLSDDAKELLQGLRSSYDCLARTCLHLASDEGHKITGRVIRV